MSVGRLIEDCPVHEYAGIKNEDRVPAPNRRTDTCPGKARGGVRSGQENHLCGHINRYDNNYHDSNDEGFRSGLYAFVTVFGPFPSFINLLTNPRNFSFMRSQDHADTSDTRTCIT